MTGTPPEGTPVASPDGHVVLGGKYVLGDILGTGGTYTVYEATRLDAAALLDDAAPADDGATGSAPAEPLLIKVLHPHLVDDEATRAALAREIAASERVDDPRVVKVLDTGEEEVAGATVPWLLTRRVPGVPLADLTPADGLPWPRAMLVADGLLGALAAVHAAGLVHRDVSPRNVVVDQDEAGRTTVGLIDLGLAAPGGGDGDGATVAGSAAYMSPEQAQGKPLDARSDLYSAGALTYFALTGHPPYERTEPADVLRAHVGAPVPAPSARRPSVPASVDRFVARAMAKDPQRRFDSAAAMTAATAAVLGLAAGAAAGADPERTAPLDTLDDHDPDRTAALGAAGTTAALAAVAAAASGAEIHRTRQLDAVDAAGLADDAPAVPADPDGTADETPSRRGAWILAALLVLLLAAGAVALLTWPWGGDDGGTPVAPAPSSASPTPSPSPSPTETPSEEPVVPPSEPTSTPTEETAEPTPSPTPSEEPSEDPTPTADPTPTEEPTDDPTTAEPDPTPTDDATDAPTEEPTDDATAPTGTDPTDGPDPAPGEDATGAPADGASPAP
ncbi:hypothetical protein GCM10023216_20540 [Isoptericola chiayiensis]|uniref:non-specific serine/threonine protein kinase n=1 Tax=Isoptericola chiayiensis TaxID=579446 RepID=A0ABP8YHU6_9MICO|nr:serine/threonine-protein kinase [Isoptericola chiayiensis]NOW00281.1 serine/threonine-protein kinase [Isoptericola chiayiensis]